MSDSQRNVPDCPKCNAADTLKVHRSDTRGQRWCYCTCCSKPVLIDAEGHILHVGT